MLEKRKTVFTYIRYNVDQIQNIFYPIRYDQDCMILELKVDHKPEEAIAQIKEKEYALRFQRKTAERKERNIQDTFLLLESVITARQRNMNVRLNNSKKSAVLLQDSKIIHASDCYNISFCSLILWYSGGYMYGMKEMVHMSRVDMWGNAAGGL